MVEENVGVTAGRTTVRFSAFSVGPDPVFNSWSCNLAGAFDSGHLPWSLGDAFKQ